MSTLVSGAHTLVCCLDVGIVLRKHLEVRLMRCVLHAGRAYLIVCKTLNTQQKSELVVGVGWAR